jgi:hypothetical protein
MNYEMADLGKNFEKGVAGKVYGETGDRMFWSVLEDSEN